MWILFDSTLKWNQNRPKIWINKSNTDFKSKPKSGQTDKIFLLLKYEMSLYETACTLTLHLKMVIMPVCLKFILRVTIFKY